MSDENALPGFPPPPPPPPPSPSRQKKRRSPLVLGGMILGISPRLFSLVASIFVDNAFNESTALGSTPLLMFFTLPIGLVLVIIGLTTSARDITNQ